MNRNNTATFVVRKVRKVLLRIDAKKLRRCEAFVIGKRLKLEKKNYVFNCEQIKPSFYLPYYRTDYIQQCILTEKSYYENANLNYVCHEWEKGKVGKVIADNCILDIGANIGNHTLYFFFECRIKKAYCFEPVSSTFDILTQNIKLNGLSDQVVLKNAAVGTEIGKASIAHYDETNTGATQISLKEDGGIPVVSIDSLNIKDNIKLIKIDVEGFEIEVIKGCLQTIAENRPYIMIEIQEANFAIIESLLSQFDYQYVHLGKLNYLFYSNQN